MGCLLLKYTRNNTKVFYCIFNVNKRVVVSKYARKYKSIPLYIFQVNKRVVVLKYTRKYIIIPLYIFQVNKRVVVLKYTRKYEVFFCIFRVNKRVVVLFVEEAIQRQQTCMTQTYHLSIKVTDLWRYPSLQSVNIELKASIAK